MSAKAYIYPQNPDAYKFESLTFVTPESCWAPAVFAAPDTVLDLYGKQLAVDFLSYAGREIDGDGEEKLSAIVSAMPKEHGRVERAFLAHIAMGAIVHSKLMPEEH